MGWCLLALGLASLLLPLRTLQVTGPSMEPTLKQGDRHLLDRLYYRLTGLQVGDVVVIEHNGERLVKRVEALPGHELQVVRDMQERVIFAVNLTLHPRLRGVVTPRREEVFVPRNALYLMGDNFVRSEDSRQFGWIPVRDVVGIVRHWNFSRVFPRPNRPPRGRGARGPGPPATLR